MAITIRRGEKKYFERVEHVEGVRYEIALTGHAIYLDRQVSVMSQWVGGIFLGLLAHVIGVIVQFFLLRAAHNSVRIPYRSLRTTAVRRVPRTMILLLGLALTIVLPLLIAVIGGYFSQMAGTLLPAFPILAFVTFLLGCLTTIILLIRFPRTVLAFGCEPREYDFHSLGDELLVHEIVERVLALQDRLVASQDREFPRELVKLKNPPPPLFPARNAKDEPRLGNRAGSTKAHSAAEDYTPRSLRS